MERMLLAWTFYPSVVIGCIVLLIAYYWFTKLQFNLRSVNFFFGVLAVFLALCSPLDALADLLFSAHMVQHMILHLVVPPLLISAMPESFVRSWLRIPLVAPLERFLGHPLVALVIGTATFWVWHHPFLYDATLANEALHAFEHLTFLVSGVIMWWPVFKPIPEGRLDPVSAIGYVFIVAAIEGLLGIIFALADTTYYAGYVNPEDPNHFLPIIRQQWGLTQLSDQKLGGAIMWGLGTVVFLWAMCLSVIEWFTEPKHVHEEERSIEHVTAE